ncbi:MAG: CopG family antitoxin [Bacillota bacterium]
MPKIPKFKSDKEAADFWDTHSLVDYEEDLEQVEIEFVRPKQRTILIHLESGDLEKLKLAAKQRGVDHSSLLQMWVKEHLAQL